MIVAFLDGISPWWWVCVGVVLAAAEMLTLSFFLIWPGLAALAMALILWAAPGLSGPLQLVLFAALSIAITFAGRSLVRQLGDGAEASEQALNQRSEALVGRQARVIRYRDGRGTVEIDGIPWRAAAAEPLSVGGTVVVTETEGTLLHVARSEAGTPAK